MLFDKSLPGAMREEQEEAWAETRSFFFFLHYGVPTH